MIREWQSVARECASATVVVAATILGICGAFETSAQAETWMVRHSVDTSSGRISYLEQGKGPVALFVHGVLLNGYLWRHQLEDLSDIRRRIAVDLLAHGDTQIAPGQDVSVTANAKMLKEFLDALKIEQVDLVANDTLTRESERVRRHSVPTAQPEFALCARRAAPSFPQAVAFGTVFHKVFLVALAFRDDARVEGDTRKPARTSRGASLHREAVCAGDRSSESGHADRTARRATRYGCSDEFGAFHNVSRRCAVELHRSGTDVGSKFERHLGPDFPAGRRKAADRRFRRSEAEIENGNGPLILNVRAVESAVFWQGHIEPAVVALKQGSRWGKSCRTRNEGGFQRGDSCGRDSIDRARPAFPAFPSRAIEIAVGGLNQAGLGVITHAARALGEVVELLKCAGGRNAKDGPHAVSAARIASAIEVSVARLNQRTHGLLSVGIALCERVQNCDRARGRHLEHGSVTRGSAKFGCSVEVSIGSVGQPGRGVFAVPGFGVSSELVKDLVTAGPRDAENCALIVVFVGVASLLRCSVKVAVGCLDQTAGSESAVTR